MKIASISLQNFKSYRDVQTIPFGIDDKCITIFEGQMGHGKSNLLNAFYWCLFGQYWDSDKSVLIDDPNPNEVDLFNKGELLDKMLDGSRINLFVEIEFYDDDKNKYTLRRSQNGSFISKSWKFDKHSKIGLTKIDAGSGGYKDYSTDEAVGEVARFFPRSLSNYFLFRGENRAQLVKLQGKEEFRSALKELSKIEVFNRTESHLETVLDHLRRELAAQASDSIKKEMEAILKGKKAALDSKNEYDAELKKLIAIEQEKKDSYEYYRTKIKENQTALEYQSKKENEESLIVELRKKILQLNDTKQRELTKKWGAICVNSLFDEIKTMYDEAVNSGHYPPDISQNLIDKILHDLTCICSTKFSAESEIYKKLERLREYGRIDVKLLHEVEKVIHEIELGSKLINSYPGRIKELDLSVRNLLDEIRSKEIIINGYKTKIGAIDFTLEELQNKQDEANDEYIKTRDSIRINKDWSDAKQKEIANFEAEMTRLEGKLDRSNLPAIKVDLAEKALSATKLLKKKFENSIYDDLEKYTQENWEILVYDKLYYEKVLLDRNSMYFEVLDKNGQPSRAIMNTGHSILLVLSFISALIKIAKDVWEEEFPLILDAPLSEIGDSAMPKSLLGFGKIFNQTIVILKDGSVNTTIFNQIKEKVGKRYWIEFDHKRQHTKILTTAN